MSIKAVLFDLDGTLLPLDNAELSARYFKELLGFMTRRGHDAQLFRRALFSGLEAMFKNDGGSSNEEVFHRVFCGVYGSLPDEDFDSFYKTAFINVKEVCGHSECALKAVRAARERGFTVALATQPVFPRVATEMRMAWAGLSPEDFAHVTTYENSGFSKPTEGYYMSIAEVLGVLPEECLMVGNDVLDDMSAAGVGMKVFLLTDYLINEKDADISVYPRGSFDELLRYISEL